MKGYCLLLCGVPSKETPLSHSEMDPVAAASLLLAACISVYLLIINVWRSQRGERPPGPMPLPLVGNLLQLKGGQIVKSLLKLRDTYGPVFTIYLGPRPVVVICGYSAIKEAFIDQGDDFVARGGLPIFETIASGYGVGVSNGEQWKELRRFTLMTLKNFGMGKRNIEEKIQDEAQHLVEEFRNTKETSCDPTNVLNMAAANVVFSITVGARFDYENKKIKRLLEDIREGFRLMCTKWGQLYDMFPKVMNYLPGPHKTMFEHFKHMENFIVERIQTNQRTLDLNSPRDFIDCFLIKMEEEKKHLSSKFHLMNLVMTVLDLIIGGTETITTTLKHGLLILMKHPDILEKVQEEIDRVIGEKLNPETQDRNNMPFTNAVVHEIQRYSDIIPMGGAHCVTRDTPFRKYVITKGTDIFPMLTTALHDPAQFREPYNFNPGHFLDENGSFKKNDAFMPFSIGKRNCLAEGLARTELFLFFTTILKTFNLKSTIDLKNFEIAPKQIGFENISPSYELYFIPR